MVFDPDSIILQVKDNIYPQDWVVIPTSKTGLFFGGPIVIGFLSFLGVPLFVANVFPGLANDVYWIALAFSGVATILYYLILLSQPIKKLILTPDGFVFYSTANDEVIKSVDYHAVDYLTTKIETYSESSDEYYVEYFEQGRTIVKWPIPDHLTLNKEKVLTRIADAYAKIPLKPISQDLPMSQPINIAVSLKSDAQTDSGIFTWQLVQENESVFDPHQIMQQLANRQVAPSWEVYLAGSHVSNKALASTGCLISLFILSCVYLGAILWVPNVDPLLKAVIVGAYFALFMVIVFINLHRKNSRIESLVRTHMERLDVGPLTQESQKAVKNAFLRQYYLDPLKRDFLLALADAKPEKIEPQTREILQTLAAVQPKLRAADYLKRKRWLVITPSGAVLGSTDARKIIFALDFAQIKTIVPEHNGEILVTYLNGQWKRLNLGKYFSTSEADKIALFIVYMQQHFGKAPS
jgi:hypothetical protein